MSETAASATGSQASAAIRRSTAPEAFQQYDAGMNLVEFTVATDDEPCLEIKVDGVALEEHARRAELRSARADRQEGLAGAYSGLTHLDAVCWPSRHFLGAPALSATADGDTVLLGCGCGDWGCWPLSAEVHVAAETVVWREFRNGHRPAWDLSRLGPFEFDRDQYESALRATQRVLCPAGRAIGPGSTARASSCACRPHPDLWAFMPADGGRIVAVSRAFAVQLPSALTSPTHTQ